MISHEILIHTWFFPANYSHDIPWYPHISPATESGPIDESPQVILIQLLSTYTPSDLAQHFAPVVARWHHEQGLGSSTKNGSFIKVDSIDSSTKCGVSVLWCHQKVWIYRRNWWFNKEVDHKWSIKDHCAFRPWAVYQLVAGASPKSSSILSWWLTISLMHILYILYHYILTIICCYVPKSLCTFK